jgi:hypothetical protein
VELAGWLSLTLLSAAALFRRAAERREPARKQVLRFAQDDTGNAPKAARHDPIRSIGDAPVIPLHVAVERLARQRLAASVAAAKVAKRNNDRQIEMARTWNVPMLRVVPAEQPMGEMDVYEDEPAEEELVQAAPKYERLALVTA